MRALRVVGLGIDGRTVILETVAQRSGERRERFTLPADEGLHAAVRGDLPRLGQIEIELESQMRPREIQARIRAGASVEQVAAAAGVPTQRIERFAYPVLLERSRTAQLAQQAHPVRSDGPDVRTLEEVVSETFASRGHDYSAVSWDSWRGENGRWVVQLRWRAGRSDNKAHWTFHPGAHGGTVTAIDDHATDLIDPRPAAQLRPVAPVTSLTGTDSTGTDTDTATDSTGTTDTASSPGPGTREQQPARDHSGTAPTDNPPADNPPGGATAPAASHGGAQDHDPADPAVGDPVVEDPLVHEEHPARAVPDDGPAYRTSRPAENSPEHTQRQREGGWPERPAAQATPASRRGRKDRPIVPSWEDVLLGVRSPRE